MTPATVTALPQRAPPKTAQLEPVLLGAALALNATREVFETIGLTGEEMHGQLYRKGWMIARNRAERGLAVTMADVWTRGIAHQWFDGSEGAELERLVKDNKLDIAGLKRVGLDYRGIVEGDRYVQQLSAAIQRVRTQGYDAATEGGFLDAAVAKVRAQGAQLELMTREQERFLEQRRERIASGRRRYVPLGIACFDEVYGGAPESVTVVVGDGGAGKTGFADSVLQSALLQPDNREIKAALISPEDGTAHLIRRWMARDLGMRMRDVDGKKLPAAEEEQLQVVAGQQYALLERILGWKHRGLTAEHLVQRCWQAANEGARIVVVDNFNKLQISGLRGDFFERVQRMSDSLQECGERAGIAIMMLVHSTDDLSTSRSNDSSSGVHGGRGMPRDARLRLDLFSKGEFLRMRVAKANELGPEGKVFQFRRFAEAGLVDFASGGEVNLSQEKREETEAKLAESVDLSLKRKSMVKAKTPPKPEKPKAAESEPQSALELDLEEANRKAKEAAVERPSGFGMRWTTETREEADE